MTTALSILPSSSTTQLFKKRSGASLPSFPEFLEQNSERTLQSPSSLWKSVADCRNEMKAARESGQVSSSLTFESFFCDICTIGIAPDHTEKELYLFAPRGQTLYLGDIRTRTQKTAILYLCGGCARNRQLPNEQAVIHTEDWKTIAVDILRMHANDSEVQDMNESQKKAFVIRELLDTMDARLKESEDKFFLQNFGKGKGDSPSKMKRGKDGKKTASLPDNIISLPLPRSTTSSRRSSLPAAHHHTTSLPIPAFA